MPAWKVFLILGILFLIGGAYFLFRFTTGIPNVGEIIVLPIYIAFANTLAAACFVIATILRFLNRR